MPHLAKEEDRRAILDDLHRKAGIGVRGRSWGRGGGGRAPGDESRDGYLVGNSETKAWLRQFKFI